MTAYRERERRKHQNLSIIAHQHAVLIASAFSKGSDSKHIWELFPFWTQDECDELEEQSVLDELKRSLLNVARHE